MFRYSFYFAADQKVEFEVDEAALSASAEPCGPLPEWLRLDTFRCACCTLPAGEDRPCPAALSIQPVVEAFADRISHEQVRVAVEVDDLHVEATMANQNAARSIIGLQLALSACPILGKLRPMAVYHLPFGSRDHTVFRYLGMYLISQYLRKLDGNDPDWDLEGLRALFANIHDVNEKLADRIRAASERDAAVNSLVFLDTFAHAVEIDLFTSLTKLKPLFAPLLAD